LEQEQRLVALSVVIVAMVTSLQVEAVAVGRVQVAIVQLL
jgi:hypothetical protein